MSDPSRVVVSGPLSAFAPGFLDELLGQGYRPGTAAKQLQLMAHLSRWMAERDLESGALSGVEIERFVEDRRASGRVQLASGRALVGLLRYLRDLAGVPAAASREAATPAGALLERYADYLLVRRGLAVETVRGYCNTARAFLADRERIAGDLALGALDVAVINNYLLGRVAAREHRVEQGGGHRVAVAAALPAPGGADRSRPRGRRRVGGQLAAGVAGQGA